MHVTPAGLMVASAFFISFLFSGNISKSLVYQAAVLLFMMLTASLVASFIPFRINVRARRHLPQYASIKEELVYELELENLTDRVQKGLVLFERTHDPRPSLEAFESIKEPFEDRRNVWDKKTLYYRWTWLQHKNEKTRLAPIQLPDLAPGEPVRIRVSCVPHYRGYLHLNGITIGRPDLLGLFNRLVHISLIDKMLVLPKINPVEPLHLTSSRHHHQGGLSLASSIGNSDEFMSLRWYRPGDPLRSIHWKSVAKTSQLVIKEFEDEHFVRHSLILDTFTQADNEVVFESAVSLAASYVNRLHGPEDILDLLFAGEKVFSFSLGRGLGQKGKMLEVLACVECNTRNKILDLIPVLHKNLEKISGSVCIFLDWDHDRKNIYELFEHSGVDVQVFIITREPDVISEQVINDIGHLERIKVVMP